MEKSKDREKGKEEEGPCGLCKKMGHWARHCPSRTRKRSLSTSNGEPPRIPPQPSSEKMCYCGKGLCIVLVAVNGRLYHTCPLAPENRGCGYTQWCDMITGGDGEASSRANEDTTPVPERLCECGAGPCLVFTATTKDNLGRKFYNCPGNPGGIKCTFFQWCDTSSPSLCYLCHKEGHWSIRCPKFPSSSDPELCFFCRRPGHRVINCPFKWRKRNR